MSDKVKTMDRSEESTEGESPDARSRVKKSVTAAKERLQTVGDELSERAKSVGEDVRAQAGRASEYAREQYGTAKDKLGHGYDRARKDLDQLSTDVNVYVRDNPGKSVLVAAAVGFMLGFLLRGDRRR